MRIAHLAPALAALISLVACGAKTAEAGSATGTPMTAASVGTAATDLTKLLTGITDQATAEKAKPELETMTTKLEKGLASLKTIATGTKGETTPPAAGTDLGKLAGDLAGKAAGMLSPELKASFDGITTQIDRLMADPAIKGAIGAGLEKLKGLVTAG